uniref:Immediate early protein ICP-46 n=1 Tax=viral metagenome TaxID=1070528 RepID=A0A6C0I5P9_9ZZZZ
MDQSSQPVQLTNDVEVLKKEVYENIFIVDEDYMNSLQLLHYKTCDNESPQYLKECRGVVKSDNKIVSKSFGYIDELTVDTDNSEILKRVHSFNQIKIYPMHEGTVIRMFYWKHKWYLSTHKKLNAFDSKWGNSDCKTFGQMFIESLCYLTSKCSYGDDIKNKINNTLNNQEELWTMFDNFCFQLDTKKTYVFLLLHDSDTTMVCTKYPEHPLCFHIGEFDNTTHLLVEGNTSGLPCLPEYKCENVFSLIELVRNIDHTVHPGFILYFPNQTQLKLYNKNYKKAQELRGNQPDILYRYLEIRKNKEQSLMFLDLFKNQEDYFMNVEFTILDVSKFIFQAYMNRYIHKKYIYVPKCEHLVMQMCHQWHNEDRNNNKISLNRVLNTLETLPTKMLYSIVKNHL